MLASSGGVTAWRASGESRRGPGLPSRVAARPAGRVFFSSGLPAWERGLPRGAWCPLARGRSSERRGGVSARDKAVCPWWGRNIVQDMTGSLREGSLGRGGRGPFGQILGELASHRQSLVRGEVSFQVCGGVGGVVPALEVLAVRQEDGGGDRDF